MSREHFIVQRISQQVKNMCDKAESPGFVSCNSDRIADPIPISATIQGYRYRKPWNVQSADL